MLSQAQADFMAAHYPSIAKRWQREFGNANPTSQTNENNSPKLSHTPRLPGVKRELKLPGVSKDATRRILEAHKEDPVQYVRDSRGTELGKPIKSFGGNLERDVKKATR